MTSAQLIDYLGKPEIVAALITIGFTTIGIYLRPKSRVIWGVGHQFAHTVPQTTGNPLRIFSRTISIKNTGKGTAQDVEIHFGNKPEHFQIWPPCNYTETAFPDGHFMLKIEHLGAQEYLNIELLQSNNEPPLVWKLRTIDGDCKVVSMAPQQVAAKWAIAGIFFLMLLGVYKIFEWTLLGVVNL